MRHGPAQPVKDPADLSSVERAEPWQAGGHVKRLSAIFGFVFLLIAALPAPLAAQSQQDEGINSFASQCFSPLLIGRTAARTLTIGGVRHDFYDLRPFSPSAPISEPSGRAVTPGTDRRCEVAFDGDGVEAAIAAIEDALDFEDITEVAEVPEGFPAQPGTTFIAARFLNPNRIAVVQVGTREGPNGLETFLNVERLKPLDGS